MANNADNERWCGKEVIDRQRALFAKGTTRPFEFRRRQLDRLAEAIARYEPKILEAVAADLGRPPRDTLFAEVMLSLSELHFAKKNLRRWMRPEKRAVPWLAWPGHTLVYREPLGVACILGPWNYPFYLTLTPLIGSIAAGNVAIVKASEFAPHSAQVLSEMIAETFDADYVTVVQGDRRVGEALLEEAFDTIFFTGGTEVGKAVMKAASQNLTPVTLELGGKSPCLIADDADLDVAARRIAWGKYVNAGQSCVAPDYLLVDRRVYEPLLAKLRKAIVDFYPKGCGRIVTPRHWERLVSYLGQGTIYHGGSHARESLTIEPTILTDVTPSSPVMQEEIFGPILPVLEVDSIDAAIDFVGRRPHPLALYLFSQNDSLQQQVVGATRSGGVCINDVMLHMIGCQTPFGGVGASGFGSYHGRATFESMTQPRTVQRRAVWFDPPLRYPNAKLTLDWARRLYRFLLRE